ncbi:anthranilate phosphoribosyltransferase [Schaalia sp. ZJ405]|uniref:anthranilate phosphoribosyltransferase n=1 Tax=unclassified Schaalia TaxID=2691889 RepID=UPI0013EBB165|nr:MULTISPECIES: anthranilate phosphoribosyltransferase [unclassified Schaalia]QPK80552.1 anthranilate phosphoribosyltransferase [Schaalia sp. ZJ405]
MTETLEWAPIIRRLNDGVDLNYDQSYWVMDQVMSGELGESRLAAFLTSMSIKRPTVTEVHGLAAAMLDHAVDPGLPSDALDIVGTGGDGYKTVNISTMSALVLAAAGIPLIKHGNRASTSQSGSSDVIEALGVNLDASAQLQQQIFNDLGIAFLFANKVHPSMRFAAPVRRALGFPTAFNVLGPLTNPARVKSCAIGASNEDNARLMAGVYAERGLSALVFRGKESALDELSTTDINQVWVVSRGRVEETELDTEKLFDMAPAAIGDLRGGDPHENAVVAREILSGGGNRAVRDAVTLNVAAGIIAYNGFGEDAELVGDELTQRFSAGINRAREILDSGGAYELLEKWAQASHEE